VALFLVNGLMTLSILCFYSGYYFRVKNNSLHRRVNTLGIIFNLSAAIFLITVKYAFGGVEAFSIFPSFDRIYIDIHRLFALISLVLMLGMAYTGYTKKKRIHLKLHFVFLPLYTIVYISGLFLFQTYPN